MKPLKRNQTNNHQKEGNRIEDKKKTNIKFNSAIFFQIGLIVALVASAWAMNLKIGERVNPAGLNERVTILEPVFVVPVLEPKIIPVHTEIAKLTPLPAERVITSIFKEVDNDTPITETKIVVPAVTAPAVPDAPVTPTPEVKPPVHTGPKNLVSVEFAPIFPGCESASNKETAIACMSEKISRFVGRKFDTSVADDGTTGTQQIYVQFKIDKNGNVVDIIARAPNSNLEKEAKRVVSRLPVFTPGRMGDVPVEVLYMLPIKFQID